MPNKVYAHRLDFTRLVETDLFLKREGLHYWIRVPRGTSRRASRLTGTFPPNTAARQVLVTTDVPGSLEILVGQAGWDVNVKLDNVAVERRSQWFPDLNNDINKVDCCFVDAVGSPIKDLNVMIKESTRTAMQEGSKAPRTGIGTSGIIWHNTDENGKVPIFTAKKSRRDKDYYEVWIDVFIKDWLGNHSLIWRERSDILFANHNHVTLKITSGLTRLEEKSDLVEYPYKQAAACARALMLKALPIDFTEPQITATVGDLAYAAERVYLDHLSVPQIDYKLDSWTRFSLKTILEKNYEIQPSTLANVQTTLGKARELGYKIHCYHNPASGELILANRGALPDSWLHMPADLLLGESLKSAIAAFAEDMAEQVMQYAEDTLGGVKAVYVTGHSVGGHLSSWQTPKISQYLARESRQNVPVTNVTFNAPGIAYGEHRVGRYYSYNIVDTDPVLNMAGWVHLARTKTICLAYDRQYSLPEGVHHPSFLGLATDSEMGYAVQTMGVMNGALNASALGAIKVGALYGKKSEELVDLGHTMVVPPVYDYLGRNQFGLTQQDYVLFLEDKAQGLPSHQYRYIANSFVWKMFNPYVLVP